MEKYTYIFIIVSLLISIGISYYQYFYKAKNKSKINLILCIIRSIIFFLLFNLFLNPSILKIESIDNNFNLSILIDNSSSIKFLKKDSIVKKILDDFKTNELLNKKFNIDYYSFGTSFKSLNSLNFDENQTDISEPLSSIKEIRKKSNNAIVLLSDGNQTTGEDYQYTSIREPIFSVVIGDTIQYQDVEITQVNVNRYSYINNEFPLESLIKYTGIKPVKLRFTIENKRKVIFSKFITLSSEINSYLLQTTIKSSNKGLNFYQAKIQKLEKEKNIINNIKNFSIDIIDKQSKVLIVSSFLHPDLGALKKAIESDKQRNVTIHITNSNKLQITDFDIVILYQPNNKFDKIIKQITDVKKPFFLITGSKTDWSILNKMSLGVEKNYINQVENYSANYNKDFLNFTQNDLGFKNFPPLIDLFGKKTISIPNQILLFQNINGFPSEDPLLLTSDDNNQKKVFLFGEGIWKWRSTSYLNNNSFKYFDEFIGNLIQYVSTKKNSSRLDIDIESSYNTNSNIRIGGFYVDNNYEFDNRATLLFSFFNKRTKEKKTFPFLLSNNSYQLDLNSLEPGDYEYKVIVKGQNISKKGYFNVNKFKVEEQFTRANFIKLKKLTEKSKGTLFFEDTYDILINNLLSDKTLIPVKKPFKSSEKLINWNWIMLLIICLLSIEWFIRKYFGKD